MNAITATLKADLHKLVVETDDEQILAKVQAFFTTLKNKNIDWWDMISEEEKGNIQTGLQQLDEGQRIPHNVVMEKAGKLLSGK